MTPVFGQVVSDWVQAQMPFPIDFGPHQALGFHRDGRIVCGAVFNNYRQQLYGDSISVTFATAGPGSLTPGALRAMFGYVFDQPRMVRLESMASIHNAPARKLNVDLGFIKEGIAKKGWDGKTDAIHYRMLRSECRWLTSGRAGKPGVVHEVSAHPPSSP